MIHYAPKETDVVILAGDIGKGVHGIKWAKRSFPDVPIIYIAGNHEYYGGDIDDVKKMQGMSKLLGIHFLNNNSVVINGVRFLGCTLWSNIEQWSMAKVKKAVSMMNDYQYIEAKYWWQNNDNRTQAAKYLNVSGQSLLGKDKFHPVISYLLHNESVSWLSEQLRKPFIGKTVVVTHHAPSFKSTVRETSEKRIALQASYASNMETFISQFSQVIDLWVHGHIHQAVNYQVHGVPVRSNPRGYPVFNPMGSDQPYGFDDKLLLYI